MNQQPTGREPTEQERLEQVFAKQQYESRANIVRWAGIAIIGFLLLLVIVSLAYGLPASF